MKKAFLILTVLTVSFISLSSFKQSNELRLTITGYSGDDAFAIVHRTSGDLTAVLCPGTGVSCVIKYKDAEGDDATYSSKKGKGKSDIEFSTL